MHRRIHLENIMSLAFPSGRRKEGKILQEKGGDKNGRRKGNRFIEFS
jgi:hypothetical protein